MTFELSIAASRAESGEFTTPSSPDSARKSIWACQSATGGLHPGYACFVQEGTGRQIERPTGGEKVTIRVAIDSRGKAGILAVLLDGREAYRETLF